LWPQEKVSSKSWNFGGSLVIVSSNLTNFFGCAGYQDRPARTTRFKAGVDYLIIRFVVSPGFDALMKRRYRSKGDIFVSQLVLIHATGVRLLRSNSTITFLCSGNNLLMSKSCIPN
jgi:hypothetical protein